MKQITDEVRQARREASIRDTLTVLRLLKEQLPDVWEISEVVGQWVWQENTTSSVNQKINNEG